MSKLIEYLKNNWQRTAIIAGVGLIVISGAVFLILSGMRNRQLTSSPADNGNANVAAAAPAVRTYVDLFAVSIDNHVDARPVSGVNKAAIVYETPVEGNITRFLAFFERGTQAARIGPVRSARPYFLDWVTQFSTAFFFHFGGSPEAMDRLASTAALQPINEDGMGPAGALFWRDTNQDAPHNAYTSTDNVNKLFDARLGAAHKVDAWLMENDPDTAQRGENGAKIDVPISNQAAYSPVWIYDQAANDYQRTVSGKEDKDSDGAVITTKNVIVLRTDISVIDTEGRLKIAATGRGAATIYRNGKSEDVSWVENGDSTMPVRFYGADGAEAVLTTGNIWVEVVKK